MHKFSLEKWKKVLFWKERFSRGTFLWPQFYFVFCWYMGEPFWSCNFFLSIYPSSYSILILCFFSLKIILILNLEEKNLAGQEKKIYSDLTFSQYNHIQNFEEKKLFQHFANLIKIRSTRLLPILDLIIPPVPEGGGGYTVLPLSVRPSKIFFVTFFSATIDGRNLIFGHKLHIGMPYRGKRFWNHQIPTSCLPT